MSRSRIVWAAERIELLRREHRTGEARQLEQWLDAAFGKNPDSSYLADLLAPRVLDERQLEKARNVYRRTVRRDLP